jgi:hypothetical protein
MWSFGRRLLKSSTFRPLSLAKPSGLDWSLQRRGFRSFGSGGFGKQPGLYWTSVPLAATPLAVYLAQRQRSLDDESEKKASGLDKRKDLAEDPLYVEHQSSEAFPVEPLRILVRFLFLTILYTPLLVTFPMWFLYERLAQNSSTWLRDRWIDALCWIMEASGPTFIKLGQWASSRVDLFPPEVCRILSRLQSSVKPHSRQDTNRIMEKEFGPNWRELFLSFEEDVKGVGAIAQV